jgi:hypothetical protein
MVWMVIGVVVMGPFSKPNQKHLDCFVRTCGAHTIVLTLATHGIKQNNQRAFVYQDHKYFCIQMFFKVCYHPGNIKIHAIETAAGTLLHDPSENIIIMSFIHRP